VGTLPQELSSLQLTGEPVDGSKEEETLRCPTEAPEETKKANASPQADVGPGARGAHSGKSCTGTDVDTEGSSRTKRPLSPGGTPRMPRAR